MTELVFLLEEPSARRLLEGLVPRLVPEGVELRFVVFEGKQSLEKGMSTKLKAWRKPGAHFVILRDQDAGDCIAIKESLANRCVEAGRPDALVRVACRELEAWIVGDLEAFAEEFAVPQAAKNKNKGKYANPDNLSRPVEELISFVPLYKKGEGAGRMGRRLNPEKNQSPSFRAFCSGLQRLVGGSRP